MTDLATTEHVMSEQDARILAHINEVQRVSDVLADGRIGSPSEDAHVYFIQRGLDGPVKVGCSANVARRFWELQTASPEPLRIIGLYALGGYQMEARLHRTFAADRLSGEWFRPTQLLLEIASDSIPGGSL